MRRLLLCVYGICHITHQHTTVCSCQRRVQPRGPLALQPTQHQHCGDNCCYYSTHSLSLPMRPLRCVMSALIFSLRPSHEGTKLVPMTPEAISMSEESAPSAAPSSLAVALRQRSVVYVCTW